MKRPVTPTSPASLSIALILFLVVALSGCGEKADSPTVSPTVSPVAAPSTSAGSGPMAIHSFSNVRYMKQRPGYLPALLDVYAPKQPGPWPVVVMLHGGGLNKTWLSDWATQAAQQGAVVYVPDWGSVAAQSGLDPEHFTAKQLREVTVKSNGDLTAVIRFARGTATRYGGDPANVTLFGHSAGANQAALVAFGGARASPGGFHGQGSGTPEALVLFDPDLALWGLAEWDTYLAKDPGIMQVLTPWQYVDKKAGFPVTVIGSGDLSFTFPVGDTWAKASWREARDPDGKLRRGLQKMGVLGGQDVNNVVMLQLLVKRLRAAGTTATYIGLEDSTHTVLSVGDMDTLSEALVPRAQP